MSAFNQLRTLRGLLESCQNQPMRVLIVFHPAYDGEAADAVWLVDSPASRRWFSDHQEKLHHSSAIFLPKMARAVVQDAQEHHPDWTEIEALGVTLDQEELATMREEGRLTPTSQGFRLARP
jgi:hypothetical protein